MSYFGIIFITSVISGVAIALYTSIRKSGINKWTVPIGIIGLVAGFCVGTILGMIVDSIMDGRSGHHYEEVETVPIQGLKDNVSTTSFVIGRRIAEDKISYLFMVKTEEGFIMETVDAELTTVKEIDTDDYRLKKEVKISDDKRVSNSSSDYKYTLYVPIGTVTNEFDINLE